MALSLLLRNACRANGAALLRTNGAPVMKMFSSAALLAPKAPITQRAAQMMVQPIKRNITVSPIRNSSATGNNTPLWTAERILSVGLLGVIPVAFLVPSQATDILLAVSCTMHMHWGLEAIVTDYARPIIMGNFLPKVCHAALWGYSILTLAGLFYFIYNDIGIVKSIRKLWAIKGQ